MAEPANALDLSDVACGVHKGCALPSWDLVAGVEFLHLMRRCRQVALTWESGTSVLVKRLRIVRGAYVGKSELCRSWAVWFDVEGEMLGSSPA